MRSRGTGPKTTAALAGEGAVNRLRDALRACRPHFLGVIIFSFFYNILFLAPALFMMQVYDRVLATRGIETLVFLCIVLATALVTLGVMDWARSRLLTRVGIRIDELISPEIIRSMLNGDGSNPTRDRRAQALREFDVLRQGIAGPGTLALVDLPWAFIFIFVLTVIHWSMGLIAVLAGLILLALSFLNERAVRSPIARAGEAGLKSYALVEASAAGSEAVRGLGLRDALTAKHMAERAVSTDLQADASFASSFFQSAIKVLRLVSQNALLAWGAFLAVEGLISPGAMFAASILGARALQPIEQLTVAWRSILQATSAYAALKPFLIADPREPLTALPRPEARLAVDHITILRPGGGEPILRAVTCGMQPGEVLGVAGKSGSGKSTLARALVGSVLPAAGEVRIDGARLGQWDSDVLGAYIGYLPQGVQLLPGTVKDNISRFMQHRGADPGQVTEAVVRAAKSAGAHDMILSLSNGYDTELGPGGLGVSGGQAQRIGLARALYGEPAILILDEPNAFLDMDGENALLRAIDEVRARRGGVVLIAHRASVLNVCDRLLILNDGKVEMFGPREQVYSRLSEAAKSGQKASLASAGASAGNVPAAASGAGSA